jgi:hypothetical protein
VSQYQSARDVIAMYILNPCTGDNFKLWITSHGCVRMSNICDGLCGTLIDVVAVWREYFEIKTTDCVEEEKLTPIVTT